MMHKPNHVLVEIAQSIVLQRNDGKILLLEDFKGRWNLPGGRLEKDETWLAGLQREVREETAITTFELGTVLNVYFRVNVEIYGVIFSGTTQEAAVILSEEHRAYRWVDSIEECADMQFRLPQFESAVRAVIENNPALALIKDETFLLV